MQPLLFPAGTAIFKAGDPSQAVYVIEEGEVAITVEGGIEVARLQPGALFGESGVLEVRCRSATATAVTAVRLLETDGAVFRQAFGMNDDRALALVKLLCARLRDTTQRIAHPAHEHAAPDPMRGADPAPIRLLAGDARLAGEYGFAPMDITHLPFQVGNRFGGETLPIASNHACCIQALGVTGLAAPHFEITRRDGVLGVRDLGTAAGTIVNGTLAGRAAMNAFVALRTGENEVVAGRAGSVFRFLVRLA